MTLKIKNGISLFIFSISVSSGVLADVETDAPIGVTERVIDADPVPKCEGSDLACRMAVLEKQNERLLKYQSVIIKQNEMLFDLLLALKEDRRREALDKIGLVEKADEEMAVGSNIGKLSLVASEIAAKVAKALVEKASDSGKVAEGIIPISISKQSSEGSQATTNSAVGSDSKTLGTNAIPMDVDRFIEDDY